LIFQHEEISADFIILLCERLGSTATAGQDVGGSGGGGGGGGGADH